MKTFSIEGREWKVAKTSDGWTATCEPLDLEAYGDSFDQLLESACNALGLNYRNVRIDYDDPDFDIDTT